MWRIVGSLVCCILITSSFSCGTPTGPTEDPDVAMLRDDRPLCGSTWHCGEIVREVNHLRQLGKERSLAVMREYLARGGEHEKVHYICRLLFVNPDGWRPPGLGAHVPETNANVEKNFPFFPIELSDRVPFLLLQGYQVDGTFETGDRSLKICDGLELVKQDYPDSGYEEAALALTKSAAFRALYGQKEDLPVMVKMILRQAKTRESEDDR